jgi:hypothetical protein
MKNALCYSSQSMMTSAIPNGSYVLSIDYVNANYGGSSYVWTAPGECLSSGGVYSVTSMPSGWNDVISSYNDYSNCFHNPHYENAGWKGASVDCGPACSYVGGAMNDRTSSEKWYY